VLDSLYSEHVIRTETGVLAYIGPFTLAIETSFLDQEKLTSERTARIHTSLETDETTLTLIGFADADRRDLYLTLRTVQGVGRRTALAVLSCGERDEILRAVADSNTKFFREVPGLGAKRIGAVISTLNTKYQLILPTASEA
jgi:holliday junction DNA helicase RuvA